jgi:hypothetical protein
MIFSDNLKTQSPTVEKGVAELFDAAFNNQSHPQDLLLVDQHGFYNPEFSGVKLSDGRTLSPYLIGPDWIGFADQTNYEFINWYRQSHQANKQEFIDELGKNPELANAEIIAIQIEKSIYLKFWESDLNLKRLYQLSSLATGVSYNWHFKIPTNLREGSKHEIIRKEIRDKIKNICPTFFDLVRKNYKTQIRNAIAHSQFSITGRVIDYLNFSKDPNAFSPIKGLTFDQWYELFHDTLLIHNELLHYFQSYRDKYVEKAKESKNCLEVRITKENGAIEFYHVGVMKDLNSWIWYENLSDDDRNFT